ncbi:hypothetical protein DSM104443_02346 [Usitatibacter rugosus]|uniref:Uncharacterized protein n=1 Tax=Usitatibacter rugosus TaxID=2732067 RepID=A0A6M4GXZ8_9PROT|nr:hypothetical protein [Usitatibacter rugosus]QJR11273.1 hypothetical protein DSM104443_02346 [Usitatibacter rugosus]
MTIAQRSLPLDLGPIVVALDAAPFEQLLAEAANAHRIYELALLQRPGDLWEYLEVVATQVPSFITGPLELARSIASKTGAPWPAGRVPFAVFDSHVRYGADEAAAAAEAWRDACAGEEAQAFVRELFGRIPDAVAKGNDLVAHEQARIADGTHAFAFLPRERAIAESRRHPPNAPAHTEAFYAKLDELIGTADVTSVSVRGLGDHRLLRQLCERQRVREEFEISALTDREVNDAAWDARIAFFSEDIGQGFLFVEDAGEGSRSVKDLVETYATLGPGGLILSCKDEGDIAGYEREQGEGWYLYRSEVTPLMLPNLRKYYNVWSLLLAQENDEISDTQVVEIIAQWENFLSRRFTRRNG